MSLNISGTGPLRQPANSDPASIAPVIDKALSGLVAPAQRDEIDRTRGGTSQLKLGSGSDVSVDSGGQAEIDLLTGLQAMQEVMNNVTNQQVDGNTDLNVDGGTTAKAKQKKVEVPKPKGGGFFDAIVNIIKSVLPVLQMIAMFIPGLNVLSMALNVAKVALAAADTMQALLKGDLKGALSGLTSLAGSVSGPIGEFAKMGQAGMNVVDGFEKGGLAGGLGAMGDFFGGDVGKFLGTAGNTIGALEKGDVAGALGALGAPGGIGDLLGPDAGPMFQGAIQAANGAIQGDVAAAIGGLGQATGSKEIAGLGAAIDAVRTGDIGGVAQAANTLGILPEAATQRFQEVQNQLQPVLQAASNRDAGALIQALGKHADAGFTRRVNQEAETLISDNRLDFSVPVG